MSSKPFYVNRKEFLQDGTPALHHMDYRRGQRRTVGTTTGLYPTASRSIVHRPAPVRQHRPHPVSLAPEAERTGDDVKNPFKILWASDYPATPPDGARIVQINGLGKGWVIREWHSEIDKADVVAVRLCDQRRVVNRKETEVKAA